MKILFKVILSAFVLLFLLNCTNDELAIQDSYIIEFGTVCGWCAGQENISVTSSKVEYIRNIPCGENQGLTQKSLQLNSNQWNEIISSFDHQYFLSLDYDECNVCADGCDEYIKITKNDTVHEISYSPSTEIEGIEDLRQKLGAIMQDFNNTD